MARIQELNEAVIILEGDNKDLTTELDKVRAQADDDRISIENELNLLKVKIRESENAHQISLKTLQEELAHAQAQADARQQISNSQVNTEEDDRVTRRYQEKLNNKDRKIE